MWEVIFCTFSKADTNIKFYAPYVQLAQLLLIQSQIGQYSRKYLQVLKTKTIACEADFDYANVSLKVK